jgi:glycosyltransferase involved in cell wall biosynthesis
VDVLVDCAGATVGGIRRFLDELTRWLAVNPAPVTLHGVDRRVGAGHLAGRELFARRRRHRRVVALNNLGFLAAPGERWVLLHNALHFPLPGERPDLPPRTARRVAAKAAMVRMLARRADVVVTPTAGMAERVTHHLPALGRRVVVVPHPVTPRPRTTAVPGLVVCPVLFASYKRMDRHLAVLDAAVERLPAPPDVRVTATPEELADAGLAGARHLRPVGRLAPGHLAGLLARAQVIYYPTTLESFGYPLAEARANGQPVLAPDTVHAKEVAGPALVPYSESTPDSVAAALADALAGPAPRPDPAPFSPDAYFRRWLA